jgi:hypothetical protein
MVWRQEPKFQGLRKLAADAAGYLPSAPGRPPRRQDEREHDDSPLEEERLAVTEAQYYLGIMYHDG